MIFGGERGQAQTGRHEGDAALWDKARAAFHASLEVFTREHTPIDWASAQNNLGIALLRLGTHDCGTARLDQAVDAFQRALEVQTRDRLPMKWAATTGNLADALAARAGRRGDLPMALGAFEKLVIAEVVLRSGGDTSTSDFLATRIREVTTLIECLRLWDPLSAKG